MAIKRTRALASLVHKRFAAVIAPASASATPACKAAARTFASESRTSPSDRSDARSRPTASRRPLRRARARQQVALLVAATSASELPAALSSACLTLSASEPLEGAHATAQGRDQTCVRACRRAWRAEKALEIGAKHSALGFDATAFRAAVACAMSSPARYASSASSCAAGTSPASAPAAASFSSTSLLFCDFFKLRARSSPASAVLARGATRRELPRVRRALARRELRELDQRALGIDHGERFGGCESSTTRRTLDRDLDEAEAPKPSCRRRAMRRPRARRLPSHDRAAPVSRASRPLRRRAP